MTRYKNTIAALREFRDDAGVLRTHDLPRLVNALLIVVDAVLRDIAPEKGTKE